MLGSAPGTFETCPPIRRMSIHRGRPEVAGARSSTRMTLTGHWVLFQRSSTQPELTVDCADGLGDRSVGAPSPHAPIACGRSRRRLPMRRPRAKQSQPGPVHPRRPSPRRTPCWATSHEAAVACSVVGDSQSLQGEALTGNSCKSWEDVKSLYKEDPKDIFFRAFYIEVALSKQPGGNPKVHTLTVSRIGCPLP